MCQLGKNECFKNLKYFIQTYIRAKLYLRKVKLKNVQLTKHVKIPKLNFHNAA